VEIVIKNALVGSEGDEDEGIPKVVALMVLVTLA